MNTPTILSCDRAKLVELLTPLNAIASKGIKSSIFKMIRFRTLGDRLEAIATNLDVTLILRPTNEQIAVTGEAIDLCLPGELVAGLLSKMAGSHVSITVTEDCASLNSTGHFYEVRGMSSEDYLDTTTLDEDLDKAISTNSEVLLLYEKVAHATTPNKYEILHEVVDLQIAADGAHFQSVSAHQGASYSFSGDVAQEMRITLSCDTWDILAKVAKEEAIAVATSDRRVRFAGENFTLYGTPPNKPFPPFQKMLWHKADATFWAECDRLELMRAIDVAGVLARETSKEVLPIGFLFEEESFCVAPIDSDRGSGSSSLAATVHGNADDIHINAKCVYSALKAIQSDRVILSVRNGLVIFSSEDEQHQNLVFALAKKNEVPIAA